MNIQTTMPDQSECPEKSSVQVWNQLLHERRATHDMFAKIEADNVGLVRARVSLSSKAGQEIVRLFLFRTLEEIAEARAATSTAHKLEELIDAINYLLAIPIMDPDLFQYHVLLERLHETAQSIFEGKECNWSDKFYARYSRNRGNQLLTLAVTQLCGDLGDTLRNRAWMRHPQDLYFSGDQVLLDTLQIVIGRLLEEFDSFRMFYAFFIAKDRVLKFRIHSAY